MSFENGNLTLNATEETLGECTDCKLITYYSVCPSYETCDSSESSMRLVEDVSLIVRLPCSPDAIKIVSFGEEQQQYELEEHQQYEFEEIQLSHDL